MAGTSPAMTRNWSRRNRRLIALDDLRMTLIVDRDVGKIAVGHQDRICFLATQHPGLEVDGDRGPTDPNQIGVNRDHVTDEYRLAKTHGFDRYRDRTRFCNLGREDSAADIHLAEQPAAKNIAVLVGV